jgi:cytochrome c
MQVHNNAVAVVLSACMAVFAATATPASAAATGPETEGEVVARGQAILAAKCSRCHAIGLEDLSQHEEAPPFRVVVTRYPPEDLAEALAEGIVSGHPDMPEFVFEPPEIEAIIAYLSTLQPDTGREPEPAPETEDALPQSGD